MQYGAVYERRHTDLQRRHVDGAKGGGGGEGDSSKNLHNMQIVRHGICVSLCVCVSVRGIYSINKEHTSAHDDDDGDASVQRVQCIAMWNSKEAAAERGIE